MGNQSFIYRNISIYRSIMNILYLGKYKERFRPIITEIDKLPPHSKILELCFGDVLIAEHCQRVGYHWKGIDINAHFVKHAKKAGHDASHEDLSMLEVIPKSDLCLMIGSLYHFYPNTESILTKMFNSSDVIILSEPVLNLSSSKGLIGYFARRSANAGKGNEEFRYKESSLMEELNAYCNKFDCKIASVQSLGKDLLIKLIKNGNRN